MKYDDLIAEARLRIGDEQREMQRNESIVRDLADALEAALDRETTLREQIETVRGLHDEALDTWIFPIGDYDEIRPWFLRHRDALASVPVNENPAAAATTTPAEEQPPLRSFAQWLVALDTEATR